MGIITEKAKHVAKQYGDTDNHGMDKKRSMEVRRQRISELEEDITEQMRIKEKRRELASIAHQYRDCDKLTSQILALRLKLRECKQEMKKLNKKERRSAWFRNRNRSTSGESSPAPSSGSLNSPSCVGKVSRSSSVQRHQLCIPSTEASSSPPTLSSPPSTPFSTELSSLHSPTPQVCSTPVSSSEESDPEPCLLSRSMPSTETSQEAGPSFH